MAISKAPQSKGILSLNQDVTIEAHKHQAHSSCSRAMGRESRNNGISSLPSYIPSSTQVNITREYL